MVVINAADITTNSTFYPVFVAGTGNTTPSIRTTATAFSFNPSTGELISNGLIEAGRGTGSVALTLNDGYGNANVAFNHKAGTPDVSGSSGRIVCNVDSTTAGMSFQLGSNTVASTPVGLTAILTMTETAATFSGTVQGTQLISTIATGTSPLSVTSTTLVTNLNADLLDGINSTSFFRSDADDTATGNYLFNKNNPAISNGSYATGNNHIELRTTDGSNPILGFHRSGFTAVALYHDTGNSLRLRDAGGTDSLMLHTSNYNSYAPTLTGTGASGTWNITSNYAYNFTQGFNTNWNTDFQAAPAGSTILRGDTSTGSATGGPGGSWWFQHNMRHTNGSNFWGTQVAWGWEDNANRLRTRNVTSGTFGAWVEYWNSANDGAGSGLDADLLDGDNLVNNASTANTVAGRNGSGDIFARLIRQDFTDQSSISGGMVFRVNNTTDNYLRVCNSPAAIRTYLSVPTRTGGDASGTWDLSGLNAPANLTLEANGGGAVKSVTTYNNTTAAAANMFISSTGNFGRSTSSAKYKTDIEDAEMTYSESLIYGSRPVWYHSICKNDPIDYSYWGFIAEEVFEIDPRMVFLGEDGSPEGVQYDRYVVHLVNVIQQQKKELDSSKSRLSILESRIAALES